jgi:hypothetical protein
MHKEHGVGPVLFSFSRTSTALATCSQHNRFLRQLWENTKTITVFPPGYPTEEAG